MEKERRGWGRGGGKIACTTEENWEWNILEKGNFRRERLCVCVCVCVKESEKRERNERDEEGRSVRVWIDFWASEL